jgi:flagellar biosynthesis protein FliP
MKKLLFILFIITLSILGYGFYLKNTGGNNAELIIGIGVVLIAFVLMPLFIYHRYKDKDLKSFQFKNFREELEKFHEKEGKDI